MTGAEQAASDRLYLVVKRKLLEGDFHPGERIDAAQLAERHFASVTPVRAALYRLVGEHLVDARPGAGFHAPQVTEPGLRDLYAWNEQVILLAWRLILERGVVVAGTVATAVSDDPVAVAADLFEGLGARTGNDPCRLALRSLNDRLHLARRQEGRLFQDVVAELVALDGLWTGGDPAAIRRAVSQYHRRRLRASTDVVRLIHRASGVSS